MGGRRRRSEGESEFVLKWRQFRRERKGGNGASAQMPVRVRENDLSVQEKQRKGREEGDMCVCYHLLIREWKRICFCFEKKRKNFKSKIIYESRSLR